MCCMKIQKPQVSTRIFQVSFVTYGYSGDPVLGARVRDGTNMYSYYKKTDHRILLPNSWDTMDNPNMHT